MIKNLYSISGLLPAQFRNDQASDGIGWTTINPKQHPFIGIDPADKTDRTAIRVGIDKQNNFVLLDETVPASEVEPCFREYQKQHQKRIDSEEPEHECLECGDSGRSHPTLANPDDEVCECVKDDKKINVGDWVQVLPDYRHDCGDELNPGGIYVVRKIDNGGFKLSEQLAKSWISECWIRKIKLCIGTRVKTLGGVTQSGIGKITKLEPNNCDSHCLPYRVDLKHDAGFSGVLWLEEGTLTLDE